MNENTEEYKYELDTWEGGTLVTPAKADLTTGIVTPAVYSGNTPITPERLEIMNQGIKKLYEEGAISKDIYIGPEEEAPSEAKIIIDSNQMATPTNIEQMIDNKLSPLRGKVLWTNPNPSDAFLGQTITLNNSDYDFYEIYCTYNNGSAIGYANAFKSLKGKGMVISEIGYGSGLDTRRKVDYVDDNHITISDAIGGTDTNNQYLIPIYVIGYKTGLFSEEVNN